MTPVQFWDRDVDQARSGDVHSSGLRSSFDPQNAPDPEDLDWRCRPALDRDTYDLLRDEQALDPFDEAVPGALPREDFQTVTAATYPAALTVRPSAGAEPSSAAPVDGRATSSDEQQPGRGHDRAA